MSAGPWEAQSHGCADLLMKIQACSRFSWRFWWLAHTYLCPAPIPSPCTDQSSSLQCSPALLPTPANPHKPSQNFYNQGENVKGLSWRKKKKKKQQKTTLLLFPVMLPVQFSEAQLPVLTTQLFPKSRAGLSSVQAQGRVECWVCNLEIFT